MNVRKSVIVIFFVVVGISLVFAFWKQSALLSILLTFMVFLKHKILPIKKELLWFVLSGFIGSLGESMIMISGPWRYANPDLFNFPIWLIFLWGYAGILGISLYQAITESTPNKA